MEPQAIYQRLKERFGDRVLEISETRPDSFCVVEPAAIVEIATASGRIGYWPVLLIGNILVIALEGLVVSIQTTRLMLFEFFIRFLTAGGRAFKPLPPPDLAEIPHIEPTPGGAA